MRFVCWIIKVTHTQNVQYLLLFSAAVVTLTSYHITLYLPCLSCFCFQRVNITRTPSTDLIPRCWTGPNSTRNCAMLGYWTECFQFLYKRTAMLLSAWTLKSADSTQVMTLGTVWHPLRPCLRNSHLPNGTTYRSVVRSLWPLILS